MPVVSVQRDRLFKGLEKTYTEDEFQDLCFRFGIELDAVTSEREILEKERKKKGDEELSEEAKRKIEQASQEIIYKIEIPANRYDLLCEEGLVRALRIFLEKDSTPTYKTTPPKLEMHVKPETAKIRPYIVCAVLRNVKFDSANYHSFIELQDKLHQNICRKRTLVAIGTHDLDTLKAPFTYEALSPEKISFVALNQTEETRADQLLTKYETEPEFKHLKPYVPIIKDSPVYPIIYDSNRTVLSMPPIINSDHSKITLNTKNVFIESTATDLTKAYVVLNTIVCMFSQYCSDAFTVEQVKVVYSDGKTDITPNLSVTNFSCPIDYINSRVGVNLKVEDVCKLLAKMQLEPTSDSNGVIVKVPPTRSDILHACDIMEDVAIAYGYNNIVRTNARSATVGKQDPLNQLSDLLRLEVALSGFTEVLTLSLCSHDENFSYMNRVDDGTTAVVIANPQTQEFQVCRTSLLPGLLKSLSHNISVGIPLQLFEISDVVLKDQNKEVGAKNCRRLAAIYCGKKASLEIIHGLLDRLMEVLECPFGDQGYSLDSSVQSKTFFPGREASILVHGKSIGCMGILHPDVLKAFKIHFPVSVLEIDIEDFL